jgi:phosphomannomutase
MATWNKWMEVVDCIFVNRHKYRDLTDEDKIESFFIINKKFAKKYPKIAEYFNDKSVDKASAIDQWFEKFKDEKGIPGWYWTTKSKKDAIKVKKEKDYEQIAVRYSLSEEEMKFLIEFNKKDLDKFMKEINSYQEESNRNNIIMCHY